jgi:hypothetical protein
MVVGGALLHTRGGGVDQPARLVLHGDRDLAELVTVLARVVGAEEEIAATGELDAEVGLGTATVTSVKRRQRRAGGNCSVHLRPLSSKVSCSTYRAWPTALPAPRLVVHNIKTRLALPVAVSFHPGLG